MLAGGERKLFVHRRFPMLSACRRHSIYIVISAEQGPASKVASGDVALAPRSNFFRARARAC